MAGDLAEGRHAEVDGGGPAGHLVELGEFGFRPCKADSEAFDFAVPSFAFEYVRQFRGNDQEPLLIT